MNKITCPSCGAEIAEDGSAIFKDSSVRQKIDQVVADCNIIRDNLKAELVEVRLEKEKLKGKGDNGGKKEPGFFG